MKFVRSRLLVCALVLAVCQAGLVTAAPFAAGHIDARSVPEATVICTCAHTDAVECPMHKGASREPARGSGPHWRTGCGDQAAAMLTLLAGGIGIPQQSPGAVRPVGTDRVSSILSAVLPDGDSPPAFHPPRH